MGLQARKVFSFLLLISLAMAESTPTAKPLDSSSSSLATVQIVYTERPQDEEPEAFHIRTLTAVLGRSTSSLSLSPSLESTSNGNDIQFYCHAC
jgi:hypothetical protein